MTLALIRAAIVTRLQSVAGIGLVHDRERFADRPTDLKALYLSGGIVKGWHVRRLARQELLVDVGRTRIRNDWRIKGYRSFDDSASSELAFDDTIEAIVAAFKADDQLGGTVDTCIDLDEPEEAGIQLLSSQPVMFCSVLCHGAELALRTWHFE